MNIYKNKALLTPLAVLVITLFTQSSLAQTPWFIELSAGEARLDSDNPERFLLVRYYPSSTNRLADAGYINELEPDDGNNYKIAIGRKFGDYWSVDLAYSEFRKIGAEGSRAPATNIDQFYSLQSELDLKGLNLSLSGILPVSNRLNLFAKAGLFTFDADQRSVATLVEDGGLIPGSRFWFSAFGASFDQATRALPITIETEDSSTRFSYSIGSSYQLSSLLELKLEYQLLPNINKFDIEVLSLGIAYSF